MQTVSLRAHISSLFVLRRTPAGTQVLLLKRVGNLKGEWCQIAGKLETGETAWQAALREMTEETGLTPSQFYSADICEQFYEVSLDTITLAPVFVAYVEPDAQVVLNPEHSAFLWVSIDTAIEMVPFGGQRKVLRYIEDEFIVRSPNPLLKIEHRA